MAKEYIERDALIDAIESTDWYHLSVQRNMVHGAVYGDNAWYKAEDIYKVLEEAPAADVVEVVRCKDCTHWGGVTFGNVCRRWSAPLAGLKNCTNPDGFCSYGERRDNNADKE